MERNSTPTKTIVVLLVLFLLSFVGFLQVAKAAQVTLEWEWSGVSSELAGYKVYYKKKSSTSYNGTEADQGPSPIVVLKKQIINVYKPKFILTGLDIDIENYCFKVSSFSIREKGTVVLGGYSNVACRNNNGLVVHSPNSVPVLKSVTTVK